MGPANTLSRKDEIETSDDNSEITLLKGKDQYFHIRAIDTALAKKISSSSEGDLIVTKALTAMNNNNGEPWIPEPQRLTGNSSTTPCISNTASTFPHWLVMT